MIRANREEGRRLFQEASSVFAVMEHNGLRIDVPYLDLKIKETEEEIRRLEGEMRQDEHYSLWRKEFGAKANVGSGEQLGKLVFGKLGHKSAGKTATGRDKADEKSLMTVDLPIVKNYLRMKKLEKTKSTFLGGIRKYVVEGFLHPSFNLHLARTFRSTSSDPNSQNFPVRNSEMSKLVRTAFIPRKDRCLVEIDYSGIEVRISVCYTYDPVMISYINDPAKDMHRDMAMECYLLPEQEITKTIRYCAKNQFVFPQFYGSYYIDCARELWGSIETMKLTTASQTPLEKHLAGKGIKALGELNEKKRPVQGTFEHHIQQVERNFWGERFSVYAEWKEKWWQAYLKAGGFDMLTGFRVEGLYDRNDVINYPVQGAAFHCLLWSLIETQKWIDKYKMRTLLVCQIHDCILADVPFDELQDYIHFVQRTIRKRLPAAWKWIIVPMDTEVDVAHSNWFEKKQWVEKDGDWGPK